MARPYRWLEYLTLGRALERCRLHFLPRLADRTNALILGDGDGRFLTALLKQNPELTADAIDSSATMLHLLDARCKRSAPSAAVRLHTHHSDALKYLATNSPATCDLVVTHFFLDCLSQSEVETLSLAIRARLVPGAVWILSDFRIPSGSLRYAAKLLVRSLYLAFRMLTGLRVKHLPDHEAALTLAGFTRIAHARSMSGMLTTELWIYAGVA